MYSTKFSKFQNPNDHDLFAFLTRRAEAHRCCSNSMFWTATTDSRFLTVNSSMLIRSHWDHSVACIASIRWTFSVCTLDAFKIAARRSLSRGAIGGGGIGDMDGGILSNEMGWKRNRRLVHQWKTRTNRMDDAPDQPQNDMSSSKICINWGFVWESGKDALWHRHRHRHRHKHQHQTVHHPFPCNWQWTASPFHHKFS